MFPTRAKCVIVIDCVGASLYFKCLINLSLAPNELLGSLNGTSEMLQLKNKIAQSALAHYAKRPTQKCRYLLHKETTRHLHARLRTGDCSAKHSRI